MQNAENLIGFEQSGIGSVLKHNLLEVPPNQREYAWTELEVGQLFTDIARALGERADYFLGTIVTIPRPDGVLEVVDGQQRLATTAILLSAMRVYMKKVKEELLEQSISNDFLTGIDRAKRTRVPRLTLNSVDHELFRHIVTHDGEAKLPEATLESHELLTAAYQQAGTHITKIVGAFDTRDHGDRLNTWLDFLETRARVVLLKVPDDSDAYRMFETLNDRGLRTSQADLIKNYLFGRSGERIREVQDRWAFMRGTLETHDEDDLTVTFLRHALIVQSGPLRESDVYRKVQDEVRSEDDAVTFTTDLDRLATTYVATFYSENEIWNGYPTATRRAIRVLNTLNIRPMRPAVLAVADRFMDKREVANALSFLLSLGVRLLLASSTRSGAVETALANAAHSIWEGNVSSTDGLKKALYQITPSDAQFRTALETARVSKASLARYYLRSLETAANQEDEPWFMPTNDATVINLEHILPKKPDENWPEFTEDEVRLYGNRLGNLALIRASDNSIVGNAPFSEKKKVFKKSPYILTSEIAEYCSWTAREIGKQQIRLSKLAPQAWPIS